MRFGDTLKKAAGLLMEFDDSDDAGALPSPASTPAAAPKPRTIEQVVKEQPGPNLDEIKVTATPAQPVISSEGVVNYATIYQMASLPESLFSAEQVLELLASFPAELPMETKRATMKITMGAMSKTTGVTSEAVVADASRKVAALAAYAQSYSDQAELFIKSSEQEIATLEAEIDRRKQGIENARTKQDQMAKACHAESDRLDDVLEFFSLDVPPSKYAPAQ